MRRQRPCLASVAPGCGGHRVQTGSASTSSTARTCSDFEIAGRARRIRIVIENLFCAKWETSLLDHTHRQKPHWNGSWPIPSPESICGPFVRFFRSDIVAGRQPRTICNTNLAKKTLAGKGTKAVLINLQRNRCQVVEPEAKFWTLLAIHTTWAGKTKKNVARNA